MSTLNPILSKGVTKTNPDESEEKVGDPYECFLLSDAAKKYAIAREILLVNTVQAYFELWVPTAVAFLIDFLSRKLQPTFVNLQPVFGRHFFNIILFFTGLVLWAVIHSNINQYYESEAEFSITKINDEYIKGGIEFCSKGIERKSFSIVLEDNKYSILKTVDDAIRAILSYEDFPLSLRRAYLETYLKLHIEENKNKAI